MENEKGLNIAAIVLQLEHTPLKSRFKSYTHMLWGKSILEWTTTALGNYPYTTVSVEDNDRMMEEIRRGLDDVDDSEYVAVLFSDTPLLTKTTVDSAVAMLISEGLNALRMTRGYVFKTEYLKELSSLEGIKTYFFDEEDFITASSYRQLSLISDILRQRILGFHMDNGVFIVDSNTTYIDADAVIESGVVIHPNNSIQGKSVIRANCVLHPNNVIKNSVLGFGVIAQSSTIVDSELGKNTAVGPNAYIRGGAKIGEDVRVGDFVEIKKSAIGNGTKIAHLTYVGDAEIGENCNLGCGVVFANYDGKNKHKSVVGNRVFIGSNSNLIAPVTLADGSFIAAGTTVTDSVPEKKMAIGRVRQENKDYKSKYLSEDEQ